MEAALLGGVYGIEPLRHFPPLVLAHEIGERGGVQTAPRESEFPAHRFRRLEEFVRYRHCDFHTIVLPWYSIRRQAGDGPKRGFSCSGAPDVASVSRLCLRRAAERERLDQQNDAKAV